MSDRLTLMFLDDEPHKVTGYFRRLEERFEVLKPTSVKEGLETIKDERIKAAIVDLQMPHSGFKATEVEPFEYTGYWFIDKIKSLIIERPCPIAILTNIERARPLTSRMNLPEGLWEFHRKLDVTAKDFPDIMTQLLRRNGYRA